MPQNVRILVVDDKPDKALALATLVSELGDVETANSGKEALRKLLTDRFAVILLDVNMPGMDGFETAELIRQRDVCAHTPIIFVTSFYDAETHRARAYKLGAVDYILAPVIPDMLKAKVAVFVDLFRKTEEVRQRAEERVQLMQEQVARVAAEAARAAAELSERRAAFLAEASRMLAAHRLECEAHLDEIARLAVQEIGDACIIALTQGNNRLECAAAAHAGEHAAKALHDLIAAHPLAQNSALLRVIQEGRPEIQQGKFAVLFPDSSTQSNSAAGVPASNVLPGDTARTETPATLSFESAMLAPIIVRGRPVGVAWFATSAAGRAYGQRDLAFVEDLCDRIGVAIDNSRLFHEAQAANRMKDEFLAIVSHELRTPLTPILGWTRMILKGTLQPEKVPQGLQIIERNVVAQMKLIDDLLDVSRITTGKLRLNMRNIDLLAIVQNSIESVRPAAEARQLKLVSALDTASRMIAADPERIQQVLWNLLSNAIKFTPQGGQIGITLLYEGEDAVLKISDTGVGINPEFLPFVFDRFRQADSSSTRAYGGLGLGLAIVRHLIELHGGRVAAESLGEGRGSTFVVRLPSNFTPQPVREKMDCITTPADLTGVSFLVVDDDVDTRDLVVSILEHHGAATILQAGSAPEALERLDGATVDMMLCDIGLPGQNGYALLKKIRGRQGPNAAAPAIALTAYAREEDQASAMEAGFQLHLPKPIDPETLLASIGTLLKDKAQNRAAEA